MEENEKLLLSILCERDDLEVVDEDLEVFDRYWGD